MEENAKAINFALELAFRRDEHDLAPNPIGQTPDLCVVFLENAFSQNNTAFCAWLCISNKNGVPGHARTRGLKTLGFTTVWQSSACQQGGIHFQHIPAADQVSSEESYMK